MEQQLEISKKLKAFCVVIYSIILLLVGFFVISAITTQRARARAGATAKQLEQPLSIETAGTGNVVLYGNNNTVNINIDPRYLAWQESILDLSKKELPKDSQISTNQAAKLVHHITLAANEVGIDYETAFLIVAIESSFAEDAYNARGDAYGLCQVTKACLDEYNWKHGTDYELTDMHKAYYNLRVGLWYYQRILNHYDNEYRYISEISEKTKLRDAYLAYNYGVTNFYKIGKIGRQELRQGRYPSVRGTGASNYGARVGSRYEPLYRFNRLYKEWYNS